MVVRLQSYQSEACYVMFHKIPVLLSLLLILFIQVHPIFYPSDDCICIPFVMYNTTAEENRAVRVHAITTVVVTSVESHVVVLSFRRFPLG